MRTVIWTTNLFGADGVSTLSLLLYRAVTEFGTEPDGEAEIWVLTPVVPGSEIEGVRYRSANGRKAVFVWWGIVDALVGRRDARHVIAHLHLLPAAGIQVLLGRACHVFLLGIECWIELANWYLPLFRRCRSVLAISAYTIARFKLANPEANDLPVSPCLLGSNSSEWTKTSEEPFALIVGRMSASERYKGHDDLIEVWGEVCQAAPEAMLVIAGDGDDRGRLQGRVKASGLESRIAFTGRVSNDELDRLFSSCKFFVMPSSGEGFGLVFLEAMRFGKACIGAEGAAEEIIENGKTGLVVRKGDSEQLSAALISLFCNDELRRELGAAGLERYRSCFTVSRFAERFHGLVR